MPNTRIRVPKTAKAGDIIEIRAIIQHPMENGFRLNSQGTAIPVDIVTEFACTYDGQEIFRVQLEPGLSANPYFSFYLKATKTGPVDFWWQDQHGTVTEASETLEVT
ncbi:thiosulfate oxidation carrier complex protein SoxZ [Devosia rhizoryzae]|uniref:Thiosulfate oxidation carrier complex protein SoxZ n=1 Tax=Devosia rhizoryzae TaxID=2774137 RepID=A0ABX7C513_9HYPH|nr:thiosulfate oxidation carrier complex protein SoxZ [Devosia rhizoryzae]QQR39293.1 thiosulfate oxidation carrier complex protein SoxZ [Devosia rhizoryzae]